MNRQQMVLTGLALAGLAWLATRVQAQSLDVTLVNPDVTVTQGTTVVDFYATITNPNPSGMAPIYLNGDSSTTSSLFLTVDDTPFDDNAPLSLFSGQSNGATPIELFTLDLSPSTAAGTYSGNVFSILGGADGGAGTAFGDLADAKFAVTVTAGMSAPEIDPRPAAAAVTMLLCCIAILRGRRRAPPSR